ERDLDAFAGLDDRREEREVVGRADAEALADLAPRDRGDGLIDVVAAERGVAIGGEHLEDALMQLEDRDVEGPDPEVIDRDPIRATPSPGTILYGRVPAASVRSSKPRPRRRLTEKTVWLASRILFFRAA